MELNTALLGVVLAALILVPLGYGIHSEVFCCARQAPTPQTSFNATYDSAAETLTIQHSGGDGIPNEDKEVLALLVQSGLGTTSTDGIVLEATGSRYRTARWTATEPPAATSGPIQDGDAVTVVADGTDRDGDGVAGIEPGETVEIVVRMPQGEFTISTFDIEEGRRTYV